MRLEDRVDPDDAQYARTEDRHDHRHPASAESAHHAAARLHDAADEIRHAHIRYAHHAAGDDGGIGRIVLRNINAEKRLSEEVQQRTHRHADEQNRQDAVAVDGLDTFRLARAEILAGKGHGGVINGVAGRINERVEIACRRVRRDHVRAKGVDRGLDHDIGNVENDGLQTCRQADLDHAQGLVRVKAEFFEFQLRAALQPHQADEHERQREILRDDGCDRDARHAETADDHEEQIQQHIDCAGDGQEEKRLFCVAEGPQHRRAEVIQKRGGHADEVNLQIPVGQGQNVLRRIHQAEQGTGQEKAQQEDHDAKPKPQHDRGVHGAGDALIIPAAEITGNKDVDADGNADERADEQVDKRRCCADGGKGRAAVKFADDNDVGGVEQQL